MTIRLSITCATCPDVCHVTVNAADLRAWQDGMFAQDAFPYLSDEQRELLISKTCGPCFDAMFGDED